MQLVLVDAGYHEDTLHGSVGCVFEDAAPIGKVIEVDGSVKAEVMALKIAMAGASSRALGAEELVFVCDCKAAVRLCDSVEATEDAIVLAVRDALADHPGWSIEWRPREEVKAAHHLATIAHTCFRKGVLSAETVGDRRRQRKAAKRAGSRCPEAGVPSTCAPSA